LSSKLFTRGFYIEYRTSVIYARAAPNEELPVFTSLDEWREVKSTKVDTAARLCYYLLKRDGLPVPTFEDGAICFPAIPHIPKGKKITQDTKIVIFAEFSSMFSLIQNVSRTQCLQKRRD
jgi:hypothetical protein